MIKNFCSKIEAPNRNLLNLTIFIVLWLVVNLIQSAFTELAHDEAYYWMYSKHLDWGYFDHPPMIALLIKIGYALFPSELGVRLLTSIMGTLTILFMYRLSTEDENKLSVFIVLSLSIVIIQTHVGGFLAIPDIPVVFFAALFFYLYNRYIKEDTYFTALLIGVVSAGMLYSKYHGILVLFFTLLSNLQLLRKKSFWIIPAVIASLMVPHLLWQIKNDFPTFGYHLMDRSSIYKIDHTINYLYSQLLIAGPFVAVMVLYHAFKRKTQSTFEKALKFNLVGFLVFFFLMSFRGHIEAHWTAVAYIPMIILAYKSIAQSTRATKWLKILFIPSICAFVFLRIALMINIFPPTSNIGKEFHNWDKWAKEIKSVSDGRKVVFANSFQLASKYGFYSGDFTHSMNNLHYRKNQYDLWHFEDSLQGKQVVLMNSHNPNDSLFTSTNDLYCYEYIDNFESYYDLKIIPEIYEITARKDSVIDLTIEILNTRNSDLAFSKNKNTRISIKPRKMDDWYKISYLESLSGNSIPFQGSLKKRIQYEVQLDPGTYNLHISLSTDSLIPPFLSKPVRLTVVN